MMCSGARFHRNHARRLGYKKLEQLLTPQSLAENDMTTRICSARLKCVLGDVEPYCRRLSHGRLL
jgi:hypothetical protein